MFLEKTVKKELAIDLKQHNETVSPGQTVRLPADGPTILKAYLLAVNVPDLLLERGVKDEGMR